MEQGKPESASCKMKNETRLSILTGPALKLNPGQLENKSETKRKGRSYIIDIC